MNPSEQLESRYWTLANAYRKRHDFFADSPHELKADSDAIHLVEQFKEFFAGISSQKNREEFFHNLCSSGFTDVIKETIKYVSDQEKLFRAYVVAIGHEQKDTVALFLEGNHIQQGNIDKSLHFICGSGRNVVLSTVFAFVTDPQAIAKARETAQNYRSPRSLNLLDGLIAARASNVLGLPPVYESPIAEPNHP